MAHFRTGLLLAVRLPRLQPQREILMLTHPKRCRGWKLGCPLGSTGYDDLALHACAAVGGAVVAVRACDCEGLLPCLTLDL